MKTLPKSIYLLFLLILLYSNGKAQIQLQQIEIPEAVLTQSSFPNAQIINAGTSLSVDIQFSLFSKTKGKKVLGLNQKGFIVPKGSVLINSSQGNWQTETMISDFFLMNQLIWGNYEACLKIFPNNGTEPIAEDCIVIQSKPINPPFLISPAHKEVINTLNPVLIWHGPSPVNNPQDLRYKLKLVRIEAKQNEFEAIKRNKAIYTETFNNQLSQVYPLTAINLEYGQSYAWQVKVESQNIEIGETEIWRFIPQLDSVEQSRQRFSRLSFSRMVFEDQAQLIQTANDLAIEIEKFDLNKEALFVLNDDKGKIIFQLKPEQVFFLGSDKIVIDLSEYNLKPNTNYKLKYKTDLSDLVLFFKYSK